MTGNVLITVCPHPINPNIGRTVSTLEPVEGETLCEALKRAETGLLLDNVMVSVNGKAALDGDWPEVIIKSGDLIVVRALAQGGEGSDPIRTVMTIAVMAAVNYYLPGSGFAISLGRAAATIGGMLLVDELRPVRANDLSDSTKEGDRASPTYSISQGRNTVRPYQPMPLVLGKHRLKPDYSGNPFTEYTADGEQQILYQTFNFGLGHLSLGDFKIGDTAASEYGISVANGDIVISQGDGKLPGFPGNVDSESIGAALEPDAAVVRVSSDDSIRLAVDIVGSLYQIGSLKIENAEARIKVEYTPEGQDSWQSLVTSGNVLKATGYWSAGKYRTVYEIVPVDTSSDAAIEYVAVDKWYQKEYGTTNPTQHTENEPYETGSSYYWRYIDYVEAVLSYDPKPALVNQTAVEDGVLIVNHASTETLRRSVALDVAEGRYEVRVTLLTTADDEVINLTWAVLRSYQTDPNEYTGQHRVGVRIAADGMLNGVIDEFSGIAEQLIDVDGEIVSSSNPADIFLWFARGSKNASSREYGARLPDSRIDLVTIVTWADWCRDKTLSCDFVLDQAKSVWDVLDMIASCGRASPTWASGKLGVIWRDEEDQPVQMFGMPNIRGGSFSVSYVNPLLPAVIVGVFPDAENNYAVDEIRVSIPSGDDALAENRIELKGVTRRNQALRAINLIAASQTYMRRRVNFETDIEGFVCQRGDLISVSHDLTQWGASGRLSSGATTTNLVLDKTHVFELASTYWIAVRMPDGKIHHSQLITSAGETVNVVLSDPLPVIPDSQTPRDFVWMLDPENTPGKPMRISDLEIIGERHLRITATDEDAQYYVQENNLELPDPYNQFTGLKPAITDLNIVERLTNSGGTTELTLTATLRNCSGYRLVITNNRLRTSENNGISYGPTWRGNFETGDKLTFELWPWSLAALSSPMKYSTDYTVKGLDTPPPDPISFGISTLPDGMRKYRGSVETMPIDSNGWMIAYAPGFDNTLGPWKFLRDRPFGLPEESAFPPKGDWTFQLWHVDTNGNYSVNPKIINKTLGDSPAEIGGERWDWHDELGFPGEKINCYVDTQSGDLLPDSVINITTVADITLLEDVRGLLVGEFSYTSDVQTMDESNTGDVFSQLVVDGEVTREQIRIGASYTECINAEWQDVVGQTVTARFIQYRFTVSTV